jgi:hypothetical protein
MWKISYDLSFHHPDGFDYILSVLMLISISCTLLGPVLWRLNVELHQSLVVTMSHTPPWHDGYKDSFSTETWSHYFEVFSSNWFTFWPVPWTIPLVVGHDVYGFGFPTFRSRPIEGFTPAKWWNAARSKPSSHERQFWDRLSPSQCIFPAFSPSW